MGKYLKKILLVDLDDVRRDARIALLESSGYEVTVREDEVWAEAFDHEGAYDLIVLALHNKPQHTVDYTNRLTRYKPKLPILLLTDFGVYAPVGTLSETIKAGNPDELLIKIASMLTGSKHVRELTEDAVTDIHARWKSDAPHLVE